MASAPRGYTHLKGQRPAPLRRRIVEVETLPCPGRPGPHWLITDHDGSTRCRGCGVPWSVLDSEQRTP